MAHNEVMRRAEPPLGEREGVLRIVSDFHFGHPASRLDSAEMLRPLLEGAATVVVNGDVCEQRYAAWAEGAEALTADFRRLAGSMGVELLLVNGNHDPVVADRDWLDLAGGRVFVTHGDALFRHLSPWSRTVMRRREQMDAEWRGVDENDFEAWFDAVRRCRLIKPVHQKSDSDDEMADTSLWSAPLRLLWPPMRLPRLLAAWWTVPRRAAEFCRRFRPAAEVIVIGHTHWPGAWRRGDRWVINTGGYVSFGGARVVEIDGDELAVRKVDLDRSTGVLRLSARAERFNLDDG